MGNYNKSTVELPKKIKKEWLDKYFANTEPQKGEHDTIDLTNEESTGDNVARGTGNNSVHLSTSCEYEEINVDKYVPMIDRPLTSNATTKINFQDNQ